MYGHQLYQCSTSNRLNLSGTAYGLRRFGMRKLWLTLFLLSVCLLAIVPPMHVRGDEDETTTTTNSTSTGTTSITTTTTTLTSPSTTSTFETSTTPVTSETTSSTSTSTTSTVNESTGEFILKVDPAYHTIRSDGRFRLATYLVEVKALSKFHDEVELSIEGLPDSSEAMFNPEEGVPKPVFVSILKVSVGSSTPAGVYTLTIIAASDDIVHRATTTLVVEGEVVTTITTTEHEKKLKVIVSTDQEDYQKGDKVRIFGYVKARSGESVKGATVSLSVVDPLGNDTHVRLLVTDQSGRYSDNFTLPNNAMEGTYAVYVAASLQTHRIGFARVTFAVGMSNTPSVRIVNATVTRVNGTISSEFHPGETVVIWVAVNNTGADLTDGRVWVEIMDPNNVPVTVVVQVVTIRHGDQFRTGIQIILKSDALTGTYMVRILVSNAPIMVGGRFLDMKETAFVVTPSG